MCAYTTYQVTPSSDVFSSRSEQGVFEYPSQSQTSYTIFGPILQNINLHQLGSCDFPFPQASLTEADYPESLPPAGPVRSIPSTSIKYNRHRKVITVNLRPRPTHRNEWSAARHTSKLEGKTCNKFALANWHSLNLDGMLPLITCCYWWSAFSTRVKIHAWSTENVVEAGLNGGGGESIWLLGKTVSSVFFVIKRRSMHQIGLFGLLVSRLNQHTAPSGIRYDPITIDIYTNHLPLPPLYANDTKICWTALSTSMSTAITLFGLVIKRNDTRSIFSSFVWMIKADFACVLWFLFVITAQGYCMTCKG